MRYEDCTHLFKNLIFNDNFRTTRALFLDNNVDVNHSPPYQRHFMWPYTKGTNYIETLLIYSESNPIVWIESKNNIELIDGRQRYETLQLYLNNKFGLKESGLDKMWQLASKKFCQISKEFQDRIADTSIRVISINIKNEQEFDDIKLDKIKREIFYRYNRGITPLKKESVYKAQFLENSIVKFFRESFDTDSHFFNQVKDVFDHRAKNLEALLQQIRQSLVIHNIPITRYAHDKDDIVNKYFDILSYETIEQDSIREIYSNFQEKIFFLFELVPSLRKKCEGPIGLICDCLYWALSICEIEKIKFDRLNQPSFKLKLLKYIFDNRHQYGLVKNHRYNNTKIRFEQMAAFFESNLGFSFDPYLKRTRTSLDKETNKDLENKIYSALVNGHFSNIMPTLKTIKEVLNLVERGVLNIQPDYQREEIVDYSIASSLIESILFNLSLHPIYLYLNQNEKYEVVDGQQRLLIILGFLGKQYINGKGEKVFSRKHNFSLRLKGSNLNNMTFDKLSAQQQLSIYNFNLHVIIIKAKEFQDFKPHDFFRRINYKPCPIKPHSFELWNSYIDNRIISRIKEICKKHLWLSLRIKDNRMLNEELVTFLAFLTFKVTSESITLDSINKYIQIHSHLGVVAIKIKSRAQITNVLEDNNYLDAFVSACSELEENFIRKVELIYRVSGQTKGNGNNFDNTFSKGGVRTTMGFLILWIALIGIPFDSVLINKDKIKAAIRQLISSLKKSNSKKAFEANILEIWRISQIKEGTNARTLNADIESGRLKKLIK